MFLKNEQIFGGQPLISVIVPVYLAEKYIHRCVDSILRQTYKNLEIILVDDGSPDKCGEICDEYQKIDSRVKVIHQENAGVSAARNAGIDVAKGEYIAFIDSDDYIQLNMYEKMMFELIKSKVDICVCQWQYEYADGKQVVDSNNIDKTIYGRKKAVEFAEFFCRGQYENGVVCSACDKLYKRDIFNNVRFVGNYVEDDRIHNEILCKDYFVVIIPEQFYVYCQNKGSLTNKPFEKENLLFLDVLAERIVCFSNNKFISTNTRKLYCNMYIEYFYKAEKAKIKMTDKKKFDCIARSLIISTEVNLKFIIRMLLFRCSPRIYAKVCNI